MGAAACCSEQRTTTEADLYGVLKKERLDEMVEALSRPKIGRRSDITKPRSTDQKMVWTK